MVVSANVEEILRKVDALDEDERDALLWALDLGDGEAISAEWSDEIRSRAADMDEGRVALIPHEEVIQRFRDDMETLKSRKRA